MEGGESKCDVEISITMAGEETVEHVPECLQAAVLSGAPVAPRASPAEPVTLPLRYTQMINCTDTEKQKVGGNLKEREKDLDTALKWIKQEMLSMKEQDRSLMKQFVNLRSGIVQLRCLYEFNSSNSDLSEDGSTYSVDERSASPVPRSNGYLTNPELEGIEFRERTSSLLAAKGRPKGPITRIKWKSHEYI